MEEESFDYAKNDATRFVDELKDRVHYLYDENKKLKDIIKKYDEFILENLVFDGYSLDWVNERIRAIKGESE